MPSTGAGAGAMESGAPFAAARRLSTPTTESRAPSDHPLFELWLSILFGFLFLVLFQFLSYAVYVCDFAQRKPRLELRSVGDFGIRW
jgi:hypothetical protein